jgi:hypothetical protein
MFSFFHLLSRRKEISLAENQFQARLIKKIKRMFPGCEILKNDPVINRECLTLPFCLMVDSGHLLKLRILLPLGFDPIKIIMCVN